MREKFKILLYFLIILLGIGLDQWSKVYIKNNVTFGDNIEVIKDFFYITHHTNSGAAWGILSQHTLILIILSLIVTLVLIYFIFKLKHVLARLSLALVISGAIGNAIDRVLFFEVTDFLDFYFWSYNFPIFNVADICVSVGTALLVIYVLFFYKEDENKENA